MRSPCGCKGAGSKSFPLYIFLLALSTTSPTLEENQNSTRSTGAHGLKNSHKLRDCELSDSGINSQIPKFSNQ
jgi:hypothetical protein